ncbi:hypothetical protein TELCIR_15619 [Teladorsagia circumcincta]|uniref:Uncharacterized protein n=1 Tax=Teladorsagia circumcincta TaxID=45464 RepID=A0A2G9TXN6_TELCI|nr:hypothetical protein TELCIR_15619 [Teladorsagia circumcincta]
MVHIIDMYTVRMPIELRAVRDKDLLCHIINNMRSLQKQVCKLKTEKKHLESERDELKCVVDDLKEFRSKADQRIAELEQRVKDAEKRAADETLRREEFEQDLQLERDERDSALGTIEHLKDELSEAERKTRELEEELDQCEEECEELEGKLRDSEISCSRLRGDKEKLVVALDKAKKDLSKANHVISKYLKFPLKGEIRSPSDRSLVERKDEMAADLKIKESLIDDMTASIADYKKKVDDLSKENKELQDTLQVMEAERSRNARGCFSVIEMYRNQHRMGSTLPTGVSPPMFPGIGNNALLSGRTSPLLGCVPTTPTNFRNVLGRTLQSNTALLTPSMRVTPPALKGKLTNPDGRENLPHPTLGIGPPAAAPK